MASETIDDIVREMREHIGNGLRLEFADRIAAAAEHTCEYTLPNGGCSAYAAQIDKLSSENARLRAALKPVLECDLTNFGDGFCYADLFEAVREAQRIYNESNNGESHN